MSDLLANLLERSSSRHSHLCPRQVLGVRMALAAAQMLGMELPITKQTGLVIIETDGCFADGIEVATGATIGHRTLRVKDLGTEIAATFADLRTGRTIRLAPRPDSRVRALLYSPGESRHYFAQLLGYQVMPAYELFRMQDIVLDQPLAAILSKPNARVICRQCGEEIINEREIVLEGRTLCLTCADGSYYATTSDITQSTFHAQPMLHPVGERNSASLAIAPEPH